MLPATGCCVVLQGGCGVVCTRQQAPSKVPHSLLFGFHRQDRLPSSLSKFKQVQANNLLLCFVYAAHSLAAVVKQPQQLHFTNDSHAALPVLLINNTSLLLLLLYRPQLLLCRHLLLCCWCLRSINLARDS